MVTTTCFPPSAARRYSSFRTPYLPSYVEREAAEHPQHRELSRIMMADRDAASLEDSSSHRKRIAVACGRCRKRKIRCSGDAGNGQPCTNCKNASHAPCQFLRVSSQEVSHVKGNAFTYNVDASRMMQARGPPAAAPLGMGPNAYHDGMAVSETQARAGRGAAGAGGGGGSGSGGYGDKPCYVPAGWGGGGGYEAGDVDYALCQPAFSATVTGSSYVGGTYSMASSAAAKGDGIMYMDASSTYGYAAVPASSAGVSRQSPGSEAGFPYQATTPGLSSSVNSSTERLPPTPSRTLASSGPPLYRGDNAAPEYRKSSQHGGGGGGGSSSGEAAAVAAAAASLSLDVPSGYQGYEGGHVLYGSQPVPAHLGRVSDMYATTQTGGGAGDLDQGPLRPHMAGGGAELPYRYADGGAGRGHQPAAAGQPYLYHRHGQGSEYAVPGELAPAPAAGDADSGGQKSPARSR